VPLLRRSPPDEAALARAELRSGFAPAGLTFTVNHALVGDEWVRAYTVHDLPPSVGAGWLAGAANEEGVTLSMLAMPEDSSRLVMDLSRKIGQMEGHLRVHTQELSRMRTQAAVDHARHLMTQIDQEQEGVFAVVLVLCVWAEDAESGQRRARRLEARLGAAGVRIRPLMWRQADGLKAAGPWVITPEDLVGPAPILLPASTLAAAWPFSQAGINHGRGIVLGEDPDHGLVMLDRWNPPANSGIANKNLTILGVPGSGKSYATRLITLREWTQGARVIMLDVEREYRGLCDALGGQWINVGGGGTRINPLQPPPVPDIDRDERSMPVIGGPIAMHIRRLALFFDLLLPELSAMDRALLLRALRRVYASAEICFDADPAEVPPEAWPHLGTLLEVCRAEAASDDQDPAGWSRLAALLEEAGEGVDAPLWAGPSNAEITGDFVVLDIHDLDQAAKPVLQAQFANVLWFAWDAIRQNRDERVLLVVDEAWRLINPQVPAVLEWIKELSKRVRKYSGSLVIVTQNVSDFTSDEVRRAGEAILANSSTRLLLRQEGNDLDACSELFGLTDEERSRVALAEQGHGLLIAGNARVWLEVVAAPHEEELATLK